MTSSGGVRQSLVVVGQLSALLGRGLTQIIGEDKGLRLAESDINDAELERAIAQWRPNVVILDSRAWQSRPS